jgi:hypothetical protein
MTTTRAITALLEIMSNGGAPMRRRIEAADTLLSYEGPEQVVEQTRAFLVAVLEDRERVSTDYRLEAGKLLRKAEARKVVHQSVRSADADRWRETWRQMAIGRRRLKLFRAGLWPAPEGWYDDLIDPDYEPGPRSEEPSLAAPLRNARLAQSVRKNPDENS